MKWLKAFLCTPNMKHKINILIIIFVSIFLTFTVLKPGMWSVQDDLHIFRLSEYDLCLQSGQIPCRYSPHSALGFGSPVFNFYPPITYFVAQVFHLLGFSFIDSIKTVYLLPLFFGPIFMYLLATIFWGTNGGLISALIFATAPYQALNIFVRGALAENFALNLIPAILYFFTKKNHTLTIIFLTTLFLTHQLATLIALGLLIIYSLYQKTNKELGISLIWSLGLSAFFLIPSILEKNLTTNFTMTQGYFNFIIHFATLKQLFIDRFWGYGASLWGPKDDMSFQIGYVQWILPFVSTTLAIYQKNKYKYFIFWISILGIFFAFLTHNKSTFIWQAFPFMAYFQFPWRLLGGIILTFSFISGSIILFVPQKFSKIFILIILLISLLLNYNYFKPDQWSSLNDSQKLSDNNLIAQQGAGLTDFYPKFSLNTPTVDNPYTIQIISGLTSDVTFTKNSSNAYGQITVIGDIATINLPLAYFPKMELRLDTIKTDYRIDPVLGLIQFDIPTGSHHFNIQFKNTPIRTISNHISLLFLFGFIIKLIRVKK